jgi:cysteine desulfurase
MIELHISSVNCHTRRPDVSSGAAVRIYLDHNATTPPDPAVVEAMLRPLREEFGNPSSVHYFGQRAKALVDEARSALASLIGAEPSDVVFTSGGTEADNFAIRGVADLLEPTGRRHLIASAIEHEAVLNMLKTLGRRGASVTLLPVEASGIVSPAALEAALTPQTAIVSVMHANNEVGTVQPLAEIGAITRTHGIAFHTDAVQSIGTLPFDVEQLDVDLASVSAHKVYGPKGVGALYTRSPLHGGVALTPQLVGGGQEHGLRAGTYNVPGIVGFGRAAQLLADERHRDAAHALRLRERLSARLTAAIPRLVINGSPTDRLPGNMSVTIPGVDAADLIAVLPDLALSTGSACTTGQAAPSHVLTAMGMQAHLARATMRISVGRFTTDRDTDAAAMQLIAAVGQALSRSVGIRDE